MIISSSCGTHAMQAFQLAAQLPCSVRHYVSNAYVQPARLVFGCGGAYSPEFCAFKARAPQQHQCSLPSFLVPTILRRSCWCCLASRLPCLRLEFGASSAGVGARIPALCGRRLRCACSRPGGCGWPRMRCCLRRRRLVLPITLRHAHQGPVMHVLQTPPVPASMLDALT